MAELRTRSDVDRHLRFRKKLGSAHWEVGTTTRANARSALALASNGCLVAPGPTDQTPKTRRCRRDSPVPPVLVDTILIIKTFVFWIK